MGKTFRKSKSFHDGLPDDDYTTHRKKSQRKERPEKKQQAPSDSWGSHDYDYEHDSDR